MTQINIVTANLGWGNLESELKEAQSLMTELQNYEKTIEEKRNNLYHLIEKLNQERRQRVLDLLKAEKRAICLLHPLVFRETGIEESLIPEEDVSILVMIKSWTTSHGYDDSDKTTDQHSQQYETTACKLCRGVVSYGSITDVQWRVHRAMQVQKPVVQTCGVLYPVRIINQISLEYFQMSPVNLENLLSL